eukprot:358909-Chlamydomonas_euryale.AAC.3
MSCAGMFLAVGTIRLGTVPHCSGLLLYHVLCTAWPLKAHGGLSARMAVVFAAQVAWGSRHRPCLTLLTCKRVGPRSAALCCAALDHARPHALAAGKRCV